MDFMPAERTTTPSSEPRPQGGGASGAPLVYSGVSRVVSTPPPHRPRLFARANVARGSPTPPARLAPLSLTTPSLSTQQRSTSESAPLILASSSFKKEERGWPNAWSLTCGEPANAHLSLALSPSPYEVSLSHVGGEIFTACATDPNSAPRSTRAEPLLQRKTGSGVVPQAHATTSYKSVMSEGMTADARVISTADVTQSWSAVENTAAVSLMHCIGRSKRHRMVSSDETQESLASSTLPPSRCHRAFGHDSIEEESAPQCDTSLDASMTRPLPTSVAYHVPHDYEEETDVAQQCCSSSGAISYSASSLHTSVAGVPGKQGIITPLAGQRELAISAAEAQCLILEDSVDTDAVVTPAQLQQMRMEAAVGGMHSHAADELSTPYQTRLVTADVLRDWTGWEDLERVLTTQLLVDADAMIGVDQIGEHLPSLSSLKLNGSRLSRVRHLGTGFRALRYLWLNRCHVADLCGIAACCPSLVELYLPFNHVRDVSPVMALSETLEVLDVEGNLLEDAVDLGAVLASLHAVRALSLLGNPLTCKYQARVRDAYRDLLAEERCRDCAIKVASSDVCFPMLPPSEHNTFSHVLSAWVALLMPQLQTLNDVAIDVAVASSFDSFPLHGSSAEEASRRLAAPASTHVDPLDDSLAEELRLVEECVRDTDVFDPLIAAVDEANRHVYMRPSTSCGGVQRRLSPRTAMGVARPFTSLWTRAPTRLGSSRSSTSDASALTTGGILAGNATAGLRRRLAMPHGAAQDSFSATTAAASIVRGREKSTQRGGICENDSQFCATPIATSATDLSEDARIAALLANDSEEEEWDHFKASLLRSQSVSAASMPRLDSSLSTVAAASYHQLLTTQNEEAAATANTLQADNFDKELRIELARLRMRIAKESLEK
ncbi:hypothetical protein NXY56_002512 [Leishmania guyanensis]|uniref:Leucine-rich repeat protein (LRRP) n=2 Tax=Leishmania guyanensis species complex TaxID=38579 RepID=A0A1E1ITJ3_LEIGU|nr:hypothetical protein, conserved [Leishmania guyanensis]